MSHPIGAASVKTDAEWQAESDLNTLIDAEKIKGDKKRMKACMARKKLLAAALEDVAAAKTKTKRKASSHAY